MRLFIAIKLKEDIKEKLYQFQSYLKKQGIKGNYSHRDNLHITLAFIGEVDKEQYSKIIDAFSKETYDKADCSIDGLGNFGSLLYANVISNEGLEKLASSVRKTLECNNVQYDKKKFKSHITLIREYSLPNNIDIKTLGEKLKFDNIFSSIILYESTRINGKLTYIERYKIRSK